MDKEVTARPNQSMSDIIIMEYGSLEPAMLVMAANGKDISHTPAPGSKWIMPTMPETLSDRDAVAYLRQNNIVIGTLALPSAEIEIILKPMMMAVPNVTGAPHTIGYYSFDVKAAPGFIHVHPISQNYLTHNRVRYEAEEYYASGAPYSIAAEVEPSNMPALSIPYNLTWTTGFGYMMVWSDLTQPYPTVTIKDTDDNIAHSSPLIVLDNLTQDVVEYLIADLVVEKISGTPASAVVRITRTHYTPIITDFAGYSMEWTDAATDGIPDPADPANPDKIMLTLEAGKHTIGVRTNYHVNFLGTDVYFPSSELTMVVGVG